MTIFTYGDDVRNASSTLTVEESSAVIETTFTNQNYAIVLQTSNIEELLDYLTVVGDLTKIRHVLRRYL